MVQYESSDTPDVQARYADPFVHRAVQSDTLLGWLKRQYSDGRRHILQGDDLCNAQKRGPAMQASYASADPSLCLLASPSSCSWLPVVVIMGATRLLPSI